MRYVSILLVAICSLGTLGCGPKKVAIKPGPALVGVKLSGRWFSPDFGEMKLVHAGQKVTGNYLDPRGPEHNGRFGGEVVGDLLMLTWIKPGDRSAAVMSQRGKAYLRIKEGGQRLEGRWGYDESNDDGGPWRAEKSTTE